jgi:hypothetical protein
MADFFSQLDIRTAVDKSRRALDFHRERHLQHGKPFGAGYGPLVRQGVDRLEQVLAEFGIILVAHVDVLDAYFGQSQQMLGFDRAARAVIQHWRAMWLVLHEQVDVCLLQTLQHANLHGKVAGSWIGNFWWWLRNSGAHRHRPL